jgi:hypothetical protein
MEDHVCEHKRLLPCLNCGCIICNNCSIIEMYCSYWCQMQYLSNENPGSIYVILDNCVFKTIKHSPIYYKSIIDNQQRDINIIRLQIKKEKVWKLFYLKQRLIKDIVNIIMEY